MAELMILQWRRLAIFQKAGKKDLSLDAMIEVPFGMALA